MPTVKIIIAPGENEIYDREGLVLPNENALRSKVIYLLSDEFTQTRADIGVLME